MPPTQTEVNFSAFYFTDNYGFCDKNGISMDVDDVNFDVAMQFVSHIFSNIVLQKPEIKEKLIERIEKACQRVRNIHVFDESEINAAIGG